MSYECFELEVANGIAHIRLNRPERANSMIPSFWTELPAAVNTYQGRPLRECWSSLQKASTSPREWTYRYSPTAD